MDGNTWVQKSLVEEIIIKKIQEIKRLENNHPNPDHSGAFLYRLSPLLDILDEVKKLDSFSISVNITRTTNT